MITTFNQWLEQKMASADQISPDWWSIIGKDQYDVKGGRPDRIVATFPDRATMAKEFSRLRGQFAELSAIPTIDAVHKYGLKGHTRPGGM